MDDIELIKEKINIVDLIQEYLPLKKSGVNFKANCPFHQEHTPSFVVSPERGIWKCFGCSKGGDIFQFLMEKEGLDFPDSLETLAQKAGVVLKRGRGKGERGKNERLFDANQKAQQYFAHILLNHLLGKKPLDYLKSRGLVEGTIKQFGLGYAPQNWESLTKFLKKRGFSAQEMVASGLCVISQNGCYDRFRGRIIFPLIDIKGKVIGFSGRALGDNGPKYINTPQTPIFDKGKFLFGLHLTKGEIRQKKEAVLVEGEMDMLLSYQVGVKNVAASKGTALTENQVDLLKKQCESISLCFDTDLAGDSASRRGIGIADRAGLNIKVVRTEGSKDPAELCVKEPKLWEKCVMEAEPIYDYYFRSALLRYDIKLASGKKGMFAEIIPVLKNISDPVVKAHYSQKLAAILQIKETIVKQELDKPAATFGRIKMNSGEGKKIDPQTRQELLEKYLIALMLHIPHGHNFIPSFPETIFISDNLRQIYIMLVLFLDSISFRGAAFNITEFIKTIPQDLIKDVDGLFLMQFDVKLTDPKNWQKEVDMSVSQLKKMLIKSSLEKLSLQIKNAQEFAKMEQLAILNKRFRDLSVKLKNL